MSYLVIAIIILVTMSLIGNAWKASKSNSYQRAIDDLERERNRKDIVLHDNDSKWPPEVITIKREENYHTHYIGYTADGRQFFAYNTFHVAINEVSDPLAWNRYRKEYVVLYLFDAEGNYLETKHWYAGTTDKIERGVISSKLAEFISELGEITYSDIRVKPFSLVIDDITFGLIPDDLIESIELEPSSTISFHAPWNGEYET